MRRLGSRQSSSLNISPRLLGQTQVQMPLPESLPMLMASSMVSGSGCLTVSGKKMARQPATTAMQPMISMGRGPQNVWRERMGRERMPPTLATVEQLPMAVLRMMVGYSSAEEEKEKQNRMTCHLLQHI